MSKFNVGDIVQCINDKDATDFLVNGYVYTVQESVSSYIRLLENVDQNWFWFREDRFELLVPAKVEKQMAEKFDEIEIVMAEDTKANTALNIDISNEDVYITISGKLSPSKIKQIIEAAYGT